MSKLNLFLSSKSAYIDQSISGLNNELGFKRKEPKNALKLLLCNLFIKPNSWILVQRKKQPLGTKRANPLGIGIESFRRVLDALCEYGFIKQNIGSKLENKQTEIRPTQDLLDWFEYKKWTEEDIDIHNAQRISLRLNEGDKEYIEFDDTDFSLWLDCKLKQYNQLLNESVICLPNRNGVIYEEKKINTYRGFIKHKHHPVNGEFLFGGRHVGPWMNIPSEDRKKITINGEPTVELDREASHINAMYEVITGNPYCAQSGDPYDLIVCDRLVPRHIVKNLSSFSQGANTAKGVSQRVGRNYKYKAYIADSKEEDINKYNEWLKFISKVSGTKIHKALMDKHYKVKDHYLKGKQYGDMISAWEADLVFEVVIELTNRGIACLTVYDSFIVQSRYEELVLDLIKQTRFINRRKLKNLLKVYEEIPLSA